MRARLLANGLLHPLQLGKVVVLAQVQLPRIPSLRAHRIHRKRLVFSGTVLIDRDDDEAEVSRNKRAVPVHRVHHRVRIQGDRIVPRHQDRHLARLLRRYLPNTSTGLRAKSHERCQQHHRETKPGCE